MLDVLAAAVLWRVRPTGHGACRRLPTAGVTSAPRGLKKRKELIREVLDSGAELLREGGNHTIFRNGRTGALIPVPRHADIGESLARKIVRDARR
jgi:mRNA interferase HicA